MLQKMNVIRGVRLTVLGTLLLALCVAQLPKNSPPVAVTAGSITLGGDVTGLGNANTVGKINGATPAAGATHANENTPAWLRYLGDGSDGAFSCPSGTCNVTSEHWYSSFNVSAGAIVANTTNAYPFIVRSTGTCTIAGTVSASVNTGSAAGVIGQGDFGGSGGGGGGGTAAGTAGVSTVGSGIHTVNIGGTAGGVTGGNAGNGATPGAQFRSMLANGTPWPIGGGSGGAGGSSGGAGGAAGGSVIFICNTINFTGTIDVSGGVGGISPSNSTGPGGGGGGGYAILSALTLTNSGAFTTTGGAAGSCNAHTTCGTAGTGGNGWNAAFTIQ